MVIVMYVVGILWILVNARQLPKLEVGTAKLQPVSICVPLRNEENRVSALIHSLKQLRYDNLEILLYDDESTDKTVEYLQAAIGEDVRFSIIRGEPLPVGWKGKPHACYQLAQRATGDYLLFIDADVTLYRDTISALVHTFKRHECDALSGFPKFINNSILEKLLTPMLHFFVYMHLPIRIANGQTVVSASAASGAFIAMTKHCYNRSCGHELVKNEVVEDVVLFRALKRKKYKAMLFQVTDYVSCAMYESSKATWRGFLKNCFAGFNHHFGIATAVIIFYGVYFVLPVVFLVEGFLFGEWLYVIPYICIVMQRMISDYFSRTCMAYAWFMPISSLLYILLLIVAMARFVTKRQTKWKGRSV